MEGSAIASILILSLVIALVLRWFCKPVLQNRGRRSRLELDSTYADPDTGDLHRFPNVFESEAQLSLSVVVPAYNEKERMPTMLNEALKYLQERKNMQRGFSYEIIIVDDGSADRTYDVAMQYVRKNGSDLIRVLRFDKNRGKGAAIQQGVVHARGHYMLMVDADGATRFSDLEALENSMKAIEQRGYGIAVGSRAHLTEQAVAKRTGLRNFLMHGFHLVVSLVASTSIKDTQCGFKLFSRAAVRDLFCNQHLMRWAFDVELIYLAGKLRIPIREVEVNWTEIPGSKLSVLESAFTMFRDLLAIRFCHLFGIWRVRSWESVFAEARMPRSQ